MAMTKGALARVNSALIAEKPAIAKYLSAGSRLIVVFDGVSYRIVE